MSVLNTFIDLFRYSDWADDRVADTAAPFDEAALARPFDMGRGSLAATLFHIHGAERTWMRRIAGEQPVPAGTNEARVTRAEIAAARDEARTQRHRLIGSLDASTALDQNHHYRDARGIERDSSLRDILLHVANHGVYHRAQALNMLRQLGVAKPPRIDYLFMYYENPEWPAPKLSMSLLRDYFAYTDWARDRLIERAAQLDDASLDRAFEMGIGSIRRNLAHTLAAEVFWLGNWQGDHEQPFPSADERVSIPELQSRFTQTATGRGEFLRNKADADLLEPTNARTPDGRELRFPLGVTAMQLCTHGTHHRAQIVNMLRHCSMAPPATDYIIWTRERPSTQG